MANRKMKEFSLFYKRFLGMVVVAFIILLVLEKIWLGSGIHTGTFLQAIALLCAYPVILEIKGRWSEIIMVGKRLTANFADKPLSQLRKSAVVYTESERKTVRGLISLFLAFFSFFWKICWRALFYSMLAVVVLGILGHVFIFSPQGSFYILMVLSFWIVPVWYFSLKAKVSVIAGLILLSMSPLFSIFKTELVANKVAIWAYIFLVMGTVQSLFECRRLLEKTGLR